MTSSWQEKLRPKTRSAKLRTDRLDINAKVAKLNFRTATLDHVIQIFGKPLEYTWENQTLTKDNLPTTYLLSYPNGFSVLINDGRISELQHTQPGYIWQGKLQVGDSLEKALEVIGQPKQTVAGQAKPELFEDCILYKDINSKQGNCCYSHKIKGVRLLFTNNRISALYVTRSDFSGRRAAGTAAKAPFDTAPEETGIEALARDFIKLLVEGDFSKATENFDKTMKKELPAEKLQQVWNSIIAQVGPFVEQLAVRKEKILQYKAVFVTCKFEKGVLDAKVVYNTEKQISGLFFVPSQNLEDN